VLRSNVGIVREMEAGTEYSTGALSNVPWLNFWLPKYWQPTKRGYVFMNPKPSVSL
jgi:hypothetical protein